MAYSGVTSVADVQLTRVLQKLGTIRIGPTSTLNAEELPMIRALTCEELGVDKQLSPTRWVERCSQIHTQQVVDF